MLIAWETRKINKVSGNDSMFHRLVGSPLSSPERHLCVVGRLSEEGEKKIAIFVEISWRDYLRRREMVGPILSSLHLALRKVQ